MRAALHQFHSAEDPYTESQSIDVSRICSQDDVPEALRKKAEPASVQGSALPFRAASQDAPSAAAALNSRQLEVASAQDTAVEPELQAAAAIEGDTPAAAASAVTEGAPAADQALHPHNAAEPMQIDPVAKEAAKPAPSAAAVATAPQAAEGQSEAGPPGAENGVSGQSTEQNAEKTLGALDLTLIPENIAGSDKQLLGARSRSNPLEGSKPADLISKSAPSVSAPIAESGSQHEGGAVLQEAEQANGKSSPSAVTEEGEHSKKAEADAGPVQTGVLIEEEVALPAKECRPAAKRSRRS